MKRIVLELGSPTSRDPRDPDASCAGARPRARPGFAVAAVATIGLVLGCQSAPDAAAPERLLCPELGGSADPLDLAFSATPALDGQVRAFVAAARGLNDVTVEMERLAIDACRRIGRDLGFPEPKVGATLDEQCEPVRVTVARLIKDGIEVRISIAAPRCDADGNRRARCEATTAVAGGPESKLLCDAQAAMYAQCTLPSITFASSNPSRPDVFKLGQTLEENLPRLVYAEMALGRRLADHVQTIVAASTRLPNEVEDAGLRGAACTALAAEATVRSAGRVKSLIASTSVTLGPLRPVVHAPPAAESTRTTP